MIGRPRFILAAVLALFAGMLLVGWAHHVETGGAAAPSIERWALSGGAGVSECPASVGIGQRGDVLRYTVGTMESAEATGGGYSLIGGFLPLAQLSAPTCHSADLNCDGVVNVSDLLILFDNWATAATVATALLTSTVTAPST
jgi:hypothetical protein